MREIKAFAKLDKEIITLEMIKDTFRDKLIDLGEDEFVEWVEDKAFDRELEQECLS